jgi:hypothetical protein
VRLLCRCDHPAWEWVGAFGFVCRSCGGLMPESTVIEIEASAFAGEIEQDREAFVDHMLREARD